MAALISRIDESLNLLKKLKKEINTLLIENGVSIQKTETEKKFFSLNKQSLKEIKMAVIMDPFTFESYKPECDIIELLPDQWQDQIDTFNPDLIFIESAWQGKDKAWYRKIDRCSKEYYELTSYCRDKGIPIVFWNKEDPVYTNAFMAAAAMVDFVFTTDIDCISKYKSELGHDRIYHLHFAAQPKLHNPIEKYEREDRFCFAGAYYHRYPKRAEVFDRFAQIFMDTKGLDIYDRNYQSALPEHAFPKQYEPHILGRLEPQDIDIAYKGYYYGINMNSIDQSQSMFARRVFEMLASNTITVGNYSRGLKNYFGDLTICTDDPETLDKNLREFCLDSITLNKYRLLGLRKVLSEHLYEDRLDYVIQKVFGETLKPGLPIINIVSEVKSVEEYARVLRCARDQSYKNTKLFLITDLHIEGSDPDITFLSVNDAKARKIEDLPDGYIAVFHPNDFYGPNYLLDLALTLRYKVFEGIGKGNLENAYQETSYLTPRRAIFSTKKVGAFTLGDFPGATPEDGHYFFCDPFNYAENAKDDSEALAQASDLPIADQGIPCPKIIKSAEKIERPSGTLSDGAFIGVEKLQGLIIPKGCPITVKREENAIAVVSDLPEGKHEYLYLKDIISIENFMSQKEFVIKFSGSGRLDVICVCVFLDKERKSVEPAYPPINCASTLKIPDGARCVKLGIRVKGPGKLLLSGIVLGEPAEGKKIFLSRSPLLVLTNQYPSQKELYRNMFVHKRVAAYKEAGLVCEVMRMNIYAKEGYREFDGINVVEGRSDTLAAILESGQVKTVCVHFLDELMWQVLKNYEVRIIVWVHGAEIQPWWRRAYNYTTEKELEEAKRSSQKRYDFWKEIFDHLERYNLHFVFVSQYFAEEIFEDYKVNLTNDRYSVIHNCIDTELFNYEGKNPEQRKKILSIRPYASKKYANDLSVKCILELAKRPYFKELEFRLIGDGTLFEETLKPLRKFSNVIIEKRFLRQEEIAALHKEYGIFLVPTRMDSQGVSRDEAMSSGLVPVTNAVAAIPEFVDEACGILTEGEDYLGMAKGIERLYLEPELFEEMSMNAANRVRIQSSKGNTIDKEFKLIVNADI